MKEIEQIKGIVREKIAAFGKRFQYRENNPRGKQAEELSRFYHFVKTGLITKGDFKQICREMLINGEMPEYPHEARERENINKLEKVLALLS